MYRDNETDPAEIADVLFRCNQVPEHPVIYGRECDYPEHGCDPRCPICGHLMVRVKADEFEQWKNEQARKGEKTMTKESSITFPVSLNNISVMEEYQELFQAIYADMLEIKEQYTNPMGATVEITTDTGKTCKCKMELHEEEDDPDSRDAAEAFQEVEAAIFNTVNIAKPHLDELESVHLVLHMCDGIKQYVDVNIINDDTIAISSGVLPIGRTGTSSPTEEDDKGTPAEREMDQLLERIVDACWLKFKSTTDGHTPDPSESTGDPTLGGKVTWTEMPNSMFYRGIDCHNFNMAKDILANGINKTVDDVLRETGIGVEMSSEFTLKDHFNQALKLRWPDV